MTDRLASSAPTMPAGIEILQPADLESIRIPWDARYSRGDVEEIVGREPSLSLWNRRTGGYLLGGAWRHRAEIVNVIDINGPSVAVELLRAFVARATELKFKLAIVAEYSERRRESFYDTAALVPIEDIVVYELGRLPNLENVESLRNGFEIERVDLSDHRQRRELLWLDHRAFPWLWWNSPGEFENYASVPGVEIVLVRFRDGVPLGYFGTTSLGSWGHLDRIAVDPDQQGHGFGRRLLKLSIERLGAAGARRIALSTQASNTVSRALYESIGFRRSRAHDYRIYGRSLNSATPLDEETQEL